jgi:hypothetical protein
MQQKSVQSSQGPMFALHWGESCGKPGSLNMAPEQHRFSMESKIIGDGERRVEALGKMRGQMSATGSY